jgi:hypothetical protein
MKACTSDRRKTLLRSRWLYATASALLVALAVPQAYGEDNRAPDLTGSATNLIIGDGYKVHFHAYAIGVQIYTWNTASNGWIFKAPDAVLLDQEGHLVGTHYAGPTWESKSGSKVVGARVAGVTVDPTAIPWLKLAAVRAEGPGIFAPTKFIQRVNTTGGLAPSTPGSVNGEEVGVPYTADYFFYREQ